MKLGNSTARLFMRLCFCGKRREAILRAWSREKRINLHRSWLLGIPLLITALIGTCPVTGSGQDQARVRLQYKYCGRNCAYLFGRLANLDVPNHSHWDAELHLGNNGSSALDIADLLNSWSGRQKIAVFACSRGGLANTTLPAIALTHPAGSEKTEGHYMVIVEVDDDRIVAVDGTSLCYNHYTFEQFQARWKGYLIAIKPGSPSGGRWSGLFVGAIVLAIVAWKRTKS